jgi:hypothetical protein
MITLFCAFFHMLFQRKQNKMCVACGVCHAYDVCIQNFIWGAPKGKKSLGSRR